MGRASFALCVAVILSEAAVCQCGLGSGPQSGNQLVQAVIGNELKAEEADQARWIYWLQKRREDTIERSEVLETKDGSLSRRIVVNGRPLSAQEQQEEDERIQKLLQDPAEQKKAQQSRREDSAQTRKLLQMLPDAFNFNCADREGKLIKLNFQPNPQFHPSSRQAQVFHNMAGSIWVDLQQRRLGGIEGQLIKEVKFAGGLLGHLDKGAAISSSLKQKLHPVTGTRYHNCNARGSFQVVNKEEIR
jgi:hypothetical protein